MFFFFFNDTPTTEIYTFPYTTLFRSHSFARRPALDAPVPATERTLGLCHRRISARARRRSEEHTSELQSRVDLVCRLLLEKKNKKNNKTRVRAAKQYYTMNIGTDVFN